MDGHHRGSLPGLLPGSRPCAMRAGTKARGLGASVPAPEQTCMSLVCLGVTQRLSLTYTHTRILITSVCVERHTVQQHIRNFANAQLSYWTSCCVSMLVCGGAQAHGNMFETHIACIASRGHSLLAAVSRRALVSKGIRWSGPWRGTALRAASGPYKFSPPSRPPEPALVCVFVFVFVLF